MKKLISRVSIASFLALVVLLMTTSFPVLRARTRSCTRQAPGRSIGRVRRENGDTQPRRKPR